MLTEAQLREIMPNLPASKAALFVPHLNAAMAEYAIDSMLRTAAFVAQLAHESGEFRWMEEIWGPTAAQQRYEPVTDLSKRLGNTQPGDGKRYKGRGPIQLTGRANYQRFGSLLNTDLVATPETAAQPEAAFRVAALYWKNCGLNELADAQDFREITRRINGGFNGLADREKYFERAKAVLGTGFEPNVQPAVRGLSAPPEVPSEPLLRGFEAIRELTAAPPQRRKKAAPKKKVAKAPAKRKPAKKAGARKQPAKTKAAKTKAAKSAATPKTAGKKQATRKATTTRTAATKKPARKPRTRKAPVRKAAASQATTKRASPKKPTGKRAAATRTTASATRRRPSRRKPAVAKRASLAKKPTAARPRGRRR